MTRNHQDQPRSASPPVGILPAPVRVHRLPASIVLDGQQLRTLRRQHGLTQAQLARRARISRATITSLESQARPHCKILTLARLAAGLGTHPSALTPTVIITRLL